MGYPTVLIAMAISSQAADKPAISLEGLATCTALQDAARRLACYDREAQILTSASQRKQIVVVTREELKRTRRTLFGLPIPALNILGGSIEDDGKSEKLTEIDSTVTSAKPSAFGRWTFTLADGGVWETTDASTSMFVRGGQKVLIKATAFAFRARFGNDSWVRVKRLR